MKKEAEQEWKNITIAVKSVDWKGHPITIQNVPAQQQTKTKRYIVDPIDVAKAEFTGIAKENGIEDRDIMLFLLLYAKPGPFQRGYLFQKYKINKMLFYQWKELEKEGLGDVIPKDEFEAKDKGPVPKNLWKDLTRLNQAGFLNVSGGKKEKKPVEVELTPKGVEVAEKLWNRIPDPYLGVTSRVKDIFFLMSPMEIMGKVHHEYPEYRKTYRYPDKEEVILVRI